ncbi:MAG TPA: hypothetical protein VND93_04970 [Myxococcales bacterium]|jgi:hypothetical protein|nr:hypothetical protein [Myxococcales bacterium]
MGERSKRKPVLPLGKRRPSKSADGAREARIARELAMTPLERMALALELGEFYGQVSKAARTPSVRAGDDEE